MKKVLFVLTLLLVFTGCSSKDNKTNSKVNNNELVLKEQVIDNLVFSDVSLVYEKGISTFKVKITNQGEEVSPNLEIVFKGESDNVIETLDGSFGSIDKDNFIALTLTSDVDLSNAYKVEYIIK